jgi:hypothetical protein
MRLRFHQCLEFSFRAFGIVGTAHDVFSHFWRNAFELFLKPSLSIVLFFWHTAKCYGLQAFLIHYLKGKLGRIIVAAHQIFAEYPRKFWRIIESPDFRYSLCKRSDIFWIK